MITYILFYVAAYLASVSGHTILAGLELEIAAIYLYADSVKRSGSLCDLRGLFSLSVTGGEALAVMKLSYLSGEWSPVTWISFFLAQTAFLAVWEMIGFWMEREEDRRMLSGRTILQRKAIGALSVDDSARHAVCVCAFGLAMISFGAFLFEAIRLSYVPLFVRGVPHAYSEFHVMGVHYITVSCVLVPGLDMIYYKLRKDAGAQFSTKVRSVNSISRFRFLNGNMIGKRDLFYDRLAIVSLVIALAVPLLCVSRFQMMFGILIAMMIYVRMFTEIRPWMLIAAAAAIIVLFAVLTVARSHDAAYLNQVFEMKNPNTPIAFSQPYIYIANNYENFDLLVKAVEKHSFGAKSLMPLLTFTGIKFFHPELVEWPMYFVKEELTTTTVLYDAYYDFGVFGVTVFGALLGAAAKMISVWTDRIQNPVMMLFYGQFAVYMLLAFFTTWFSLPVTWFYFAVTVVCAAVVYFRG